MRGPVPGRRPAAPEERVRRTVAYDYGRAVNVAGWGIPARFCTPHEAEQAVVHAGGPSRAAHGSREDFSAGYALGRAAVRRGGVRLLVRGQRHRPPRPHRTRGQPLEAHPLALRRP
ncbi:DUF1266 domain-containing protein [Streptomyces sp. CS081A]|uniref:DUF1266 domain-containing protein n=1 Tax=Streptomyces TaxID=1883 RepID=UPI0031B9D214